VLVLHRREPLPQHPHFAHEHEGPAAPTPVGGGRRSGAWWRWRRAWTLQARVDNLADHATRPSSASPGPRRSAWIGLAGIAA